MHHSPLKSNPALGVVSVPRSLRSRLALILVFSIFPALPQAPTFAGIIFPEAIRQRAPQTHMGYYIGSFDPPTLGHRELVARALANPDHKIEKIVITANYRGEKDFNTSVDERLHMLRLLMADFGDRVEILREPLEGRPAFAEYLIRRDDAKIFGIFGDDTYDKNLQIFWGTERFEFIKVIRPVPAMATAEAAWVPITHEMEVDADGVSSSRARELIAAGRDASRILAPAVINYILENGFYKPVPDEAISAQTEDFLHRFREFKAALQPIAGEHGFDISGIGQPTFKKGQSRAAQNDKFIRFVVESLKLGAADQFRLRPLAEELLGYSSRSCPLRSALKAGVYYGSFDGPSESQRRVVLESMKQLNLDVMYVAALDQSPRKPLKYSLAARKEMLRRVFAAHGDRVRILEAHLADLPGFIDRLQNDHTAPLTAVFGANVFADNYARLQGLEGLRFAVVPMPGQSTGPGSSVAVPDGTAVVTIPVGTDGAAADAIAPEAQAYLDQVSVPQSSGTIPASCGEKLEN